MDAPGYIDAVAAESAALVAAAERAGLSASVPTCPGWTVAELVGHTGQSQGWHARLIEQRATEPDWSFDEAPSNAAVVGWFEDQTARVLTAFAATPPDTPMWTFGGAGTASFWFRRQAHEVSMHRCDAELAAGVEAPTIERALARDGLDEFFDLFVGERLRARIVGDGETVHVHCTDGEGEWLVRLTSDGPDIERVHSKGDVAARGSASDLLLVLRGRLPTSTVDVFGDATLLERFVELSRL